MVFDTKSKQNVFLIGVKKNGVSIASSSVEWGLLSDSLRGMVMNHLEKQILARLNPFSTPKARSGCIENRRIWFWPCLVRRDGPWSASRYPGGFCGGS
jgi:hypothetical protein